MDKLYHTILNTMRNGYVIMHVQMKDPAAMTGHVILIGQEILKGAERTCRISRTEMYPPVQIKTSKLDRVLCHSVMLLPWLINKLQIPCPHPYLHVMFLLLVCPDKVTRAKCLIPRVATCQIEVMVTHLEPLVIKEQEALGIKEAVLVTKEAALVIKVEATREAAPVIKVETPAIKEAVLVIKVVVVLVIKVAILAIKGGALVRREVDLVIQAVHPAIKVATLATREGLLATKAVALAIREEVLIIKVVVQLIKGVALVVRVVTKHIRQALLTRKLSVITAAIL